MEDIFVQRPDLTCYAKMAVYKIGYVAGQVELTSLCSQRCLFCDSWRSHVKGSIKGTLSYITIIKLLRQLNQIPTFEHLSFTGGEPMDWQDPDSHMNFDELLRQIRYQGIKFSLQVNTTLVKSIDYSTWLNSLDRVRVSLDGIRRETYKMLRGDDRDPEEILEKMELLAHPGLSTMTCVSEGNIKEIPDIIARLNRMKNPPRKAMFLAVLGKEIKEEFWKEYNLLKRIESPRVQTSFQEDVMGVRAFCNSAEAEKVPCAVGGITFHIKCNGDVYPCCLIGGEAIKTQEHMKIGNINEFTGLPGIQAEYKAKCFYHKGSPCSEVCQWKQVHINRLTHAAKRIILTMP